MPVHYLTEPVDVFYEWLDACEREERKRREGNVDLLGSALGRRMEEKVRGGNYGVMRGRKWKRVRGTLYMRSRGEARGCPRQR